MGLASRSCEGLAVIWTRKVDFFFWASPEVGQENWLNFSEDLFFFNGDHLISAGKTVSILMKIVFFFRSPDFDKKNAPIWFKTDENFGQVCLLLFPASKPPLRIPGYAPDWSQR